MNNLSLLILCGLAGMGLGVFFFGGLWWTVRHGLAVGRPARWLLLGGLLRLSVVLGGFYFVADGQWPRLVAALVGFVIARTLVVRFTQPREDRHAP